MAGGRSWSHSRNGKELDDYADFSPQAQQGIFSNAREEEERDALLHLLLLSQQQQDEEHRDFNNLLLCASSL